MITITISYSALAWLVFIFGIVYFYRPLKRTVKKVFGWIYGEQLK